MKKIILLTSLLTVGLFISISAVNAQMGPGMMGPGHGYGQGMGPGMMGIWIQVPEKLPSPKNAEWVQKLRRILVLEKTSYAQYTNDADQYNAAMPYMMVIPQEEDHIDLIEKLFAAYGLKADGKPESIVATKSLREAFELCVRMEKELIPRYNWLVQNAEDRDSAQVLNQILLQTRWHLSMFQHSLDMGGYGMGPGMMRGGRGYRMGPGYGMGSEMMGRGYGLGSSPGYGYGAQYPRPQLLLDEKNAKEIAENYLKSMRNPNLKVGDITDKGSYFEVNILSRNNDLVDKIDVDKKTGWLRSEY